MAGFADAERAHLDDLALVATEARAQADLVLGHHGELVGELEALCREHPLRQRLWELLMLALYRAGRQAEAPRLTAKPVTIRNTHVRHHFGRVEIVDRDGGAQLGAGAGTPRQHVGGGGGSGPRLFRRRSRTAGRSCMSLA